MQYQAGHDIPLYQDLTMKRLILAFCFLLTSLGQSQAIDTGGKNVSRNRMEGTWEHQFENQPELIQVKIINQDHFVWVTYIRETGQPVALAGGTYKLEADTYKEMVEYGQFGTDQLQKLLGKEQVFKVKFDGDTLTQTGTLSNGQELKEVWKKSMKPETLPRP